VICPDCVRGLHNRCRNCGCQHSPKPLKEIVESVTVLGLVVHPDVALAMKASALPEYQPEETAIGNTTE
jgi:hypothetical protein